MWTRKEIARITGIPDRRVLFYSEQKILPGFNTATGRGTARLYSVTELFYLLLVKELDAIGLSLVRIRSIITYLHFAQMKGLNLFVNGEFTKETVIVIISPSPKEHALSPDSKNFSEEFDMKLVIEPTESETITLGVDEASQIVLNLNAVYGKAQL